MDRGAWWVTVHGVAKGRTQLSDKTHTHTAHHVKARAGGSTRWSQDCREKHQYPQICR